MVVKEDSEDSILYNLLVRAEWALEGEVLVSENQSHLISRLNDILSLKP